jgi:hypothetical protein
MDLQILLKSSRNYPFVAEMLILKCLVCGERFKKTSDISISAVFTDNISPNCRIYFIVFTHLKNPFLIIRRKNKVNLLF